MIRMKQTGQALRLPLRQEVLCALAAAAGWCLAQVSLWRGPAPFAPALCGVLGEPWGLFCAAGAAAGSLRLLPGFAIPQLAGCVAAALFRWLPGKKASRAAVYGGLAGGVAFAAAGIAAGLGWGGMLLRGAFTALFALLGQAALTAEQGRFAAAGRWGRLFWTAAFLLILPGQTGPVDLRLAAAFAGVGWFACRQDGRWALEFSLAAGAVLSAGAGRCLPGFFALAGAGAAAGLFLAPQRWQLGTAVFLGSLPGVLFCTGLTDGLRLAAAAALGGAGVLLLPEKWCVPAGAKLPDERSARLGRALEELGQTVSRVCGAMPRPPEGLEEVLCRGVCRDCSQNCACWVEKGGEMFELIARLEHTEGPVVLPDRFLARCVRAQRFYAQVQNHLAGRLARRCAAARTDALRAAVTEQLFALSEQLTRPVPMPAMPLLWVETGIASTAAKTVCGDAARVARAPDGTVHLILADGAGTGAGAAVDGAFAAETACRLLEAGFTPEQTGRLVNVFLTVTGQEGSAALDLFSITPDGKSCRSWKAGAAPGLCLCRGKAVLLEQPESLPLGLLPNLQAGEYRLNLGGGDAVVLVSDGMLEAGAAPLLRELEGCGGLSAGQIAGRLLAAAAGGQDDRTVLAAKLIWEK